MKGLSQLACLLSFAFQWPVRKGHQSDLHGADQMSGSGLLPGKLVTASVSINRVVWAI